MKYELNKFEIKAFDSDTAVIFEIENDTSVVAFSETINLNHEEDAELFKAIQAFINAKLEQRKS